MGALTAQRPKPLIPVAGRALIDRTLDLAAAAGCDPVVVNLHYLGQQLAEMIRTIEVVRRDEADVLTAIGADVGNHHRGLRIVKGQNIGGIVFVSVTVIERMTFRSADDAHSNFSIIRQSMANAARYKMPW
jgi:choline kinase